jgi:hypothetical protein
VPAEEVPVRRRAVAHRRTAAARARTVPAHGIELAPTDAATEMLVRALIRRQLRLAVTVFAVVAAPTAALPLLFALAPSLGAAKIGSVGLPWLLLGVASYPLLALAGWWYVRRAEATEAQTVASAHQVPR